MSSSKDKIQLSNNKKYNPNIKKLVPEERLNKLIKDIKKKS